jgi:hypothetical protein
VSWCPFRPRAGHCGQLPDASEWPRRHACGGRPLGSRLSAVCPGPDLRQSSVLTVPWVRRRPSGDAARRPIVSPRRRGADRFAGAPNSLRRRTIGAGQHRSRRCLPRDRPVLVPIGLEHGGITDARHRHLLVDGPAHTGSSGGSTTPAPTASTTATTTPPDRPLPGSPAQGVTRARFARSGVRPG